jgi:hypothetical protein
MREEYAFSKGKRGPVIPPSQEKLVLPFALIPVSEIGSVIRFMRPEAATIRP